MFTLHGGENIQKLLKNCTLKDELTSTPVMAYFDTKRETILMADASPVGISAILSSQKDSQVVAYASRALAVEKKRYSRTEKESLGIV